MLGVTVLVHFLQVPDHPVLGRLDEGFGQTHFFGRLSTLGQSRGGPRQHRQAAVKIDRDVGQPLLVILLVKDVLLVFPQERLDRMFAFYNANWQEYYGTEKTFTLE